MPPQPGKAKDETKKFANRRVLLTYKTHIPKEPWIKWLKEKICFEPDVIRVAHESADEHHPYYHSHMVVDFGKAFQTANMFYFDYPSQVPLEPDIHPQLRFLSCAKALKDALAYLAKEDPDNSDLLDIATPVAEVYWGKTLQDALRLAQKPSDASGIVTLWENRPQQKIKLLDDEKLTHNWQFDFCREFGPDTSGEKRPIYWYYDKSGNCGKSTLADYLELVEPENWFKLQVQKNKKTYTPSLKVKFKKDGQDMVSS